MLIYSLYYVHDYYLTFILFVDHCYIIYHITLYYIYFDDFDNDYYYNNDDDDYYYYTTMILL